MTPFLETFNPQNDRNQKLVIEKAFAEAGVVILKDTPNRIYIGDHGECCVKLEGDVKASQLAKLMQTGLAEDFNITWSATELWVEWQSR